MTWWDRHLWLLGLLGLALTVLYGVEKVLPLPVFVLLDLGYVVLGLMWIRRRGQRGLFALPAVLLFSLAAYTGPPSARRPGEMVVNTVALLLAAVALLVITSWWAWRIRTATAVVSVVLLTAGSVVYLANLLARFAIVLAGAADHQAAVEDRAWQAYSYLRGLDGTPDFMIVLLVWLDLLQLTYVVLCYVSGAVFVVALRTAGLIDDRAGRVVSLTGVALTALVVVGCATGTVVPASTWVAFVLTIPFMVTAIPLVLASLDPPKGYPASALA